MNIIWKGSPNFGYPTGAHGRGGQRIVAIVDHIAQGTQAGLDAIFANPASAVSAHYGVMRDGAVHHYVAETNAAYANGVLLNPDTTIPWLQDAFPGGLAHAGVMANCRCVSIEHEGYSGQPFTPEQQAATMELHRDIVARHNIVVDRHHIIGHYRLNPVARAGCPGAAFPWGDLFQALRGAGGGNMNRAQLAELAAIADVLANSQDTTRGLAAVMDRLHDAIESTGFGYSDTAFSRLASDLRGLAQRVRNLPNLG